MAVVRFADWKVRVPVGRQWCRLWRAGMSAVSVDGRAGFLTRETVGANLQRVMTAFLSLYGLVDDIVAVYLGDGLPAQFCAECDRDTWHGVTGTILIGLVCEVFAGEVILPDP